MTSARRGGTNRTVIGSIGAASDAALADADAPGDPGGDVRTSGRRTRPTSPSASPATAMRAPRPLSASANELEIGVGALTTGLRLDVMRRRIAVGSATAAPSTAVPGPASATAFITSVRMLRRRIASRYCAAVGRRSGSFSSARALSSPNQRGIAARRRRSGDGWLTMRSIISVSDIAGKTTSPVSISCAVSASAQMSTAPVASRAASTSGGM